MPFGSFPAPGLFLPSRSIPPSVVTVAGAAAKFRGPGSVAYLIQYFRCGSCRRPLRFARRGLSRCGGSHLHFTPTYWHDTPAEYGWPKALYNRWKRRNGMSVFARMMAGLAAEADAQATIMIVATFLKAHRTASSLRVKKGAWASHRTHQRWAEHQAARRR